MEPRNKTTDGEHGFDTTRKVHMGQIVEKPRGDLEKVLPREDLKRRDVPLRKIPSHSDSPEGELFSDITQGFSTICQTLVF